MRLTLFVLGGIAIVIGAVAARALRRRRKRISPWIGLGGQEVREREMQMNLESGEKQSRAPVSFNALGEPITSETLTVIERPDGRTVTTEEPLTGETSMNRVSPEEEPRIQADIREPLAEVIPHEDGSAVQLRERPAENAPEQPSDSHVERDSALGDEKKPSDAGRGQRGEESAPTEPPHDSRALARTQMESHDQSTQSDASFDAGGGDAYHGVVASAQKAAEEEVGSAAEKGLASSVDAMAEQPLAGNEDVEGPASSVGKARQGLAAPRKYRPPRSLQPTGRAERPESGSEAAQLRSLGIDVRLILQPGGFCKVCLLPRRTLDLPTQANVTSFDGNLVELTALQDEWYEDLVLPNMSDLLRSGISWEWRDADGRQTRWSLSGREIYVLGRHEELSGFVSRPRLLLGERQAVICTSEHREEVIRVIAAAGSPSPEILDDQSGMVPGWLALLGIVPSRAVTPSTSGEILDVLRPLPDVQIVFDGGVRIGRTTWLSGHPPAIRVLGSATEVTLKIDGEDATVGPNEALTVPGWDDVGQHNVWCVSQARSYEIRDGLEEWDSWDAYAWSLGDVSPAKDLAVGAICGALVRSAREVLGSPPSIIVPAANSVLLGRVPGQIYHCRVHSEGPVGVAIGFPNFDPVWAVPANPLHCDKKSNRVLLLGSARPAERLAKIARHLHGKNSRGDEQKRIREWYTCVLEVSRKRIPLGCESLQRLWFSYKREANRIRRAWK